MKKKLILLFRLVILSLLFYTNAVSTVSAANGNLYQGYHKFDSEGSLGYRIIEDDIHHIAYCYDHDASAPEGIDSEYKTMYEKIESYLESDDFFTEKYGKEKKQRIATVLVTGYPINMYGTFEKYYLTEREAIKVVQTLVWDINEGTDGELNDFTGWGFTREMVKYYNELYHFSKVTSFEQGNLVLEGDFTLRNRGDYYSTDCLKTRGYKGSFRFENLPPGIEVRDFNTNAVLNGEIKVGREFYIISQNETLGDVSLLIEYSYQEVELYFYKYHSGGDPYIGRPYQNLVRAHLTDNVKTIDLELKADGTIEKPGENISISVEKKWIGETEAEADIRLEANGSVVRQIILCNQNNWKYTFEELPRYDSETGEQIEYTVSEVPIEGYQTTITGDSASGFLITNTSLPDLLISKTVTGEMGDKTKPFTFSIQIKDVEGNPIDGAYGYVGSIKDGYDQEATKPEDGTVYFVNGNAEIKLLHGQQIKILNLPINCTFLVQEVEANQDDYITSYNGEISMDEAILDQDKEIHVENNKEIIPDTGIIVNMKTVLIMFTGIMMIVGTLLSSLLYRKNRYHEDGSK